MNTKKVHYWKPLLLALLVTVAIPVVFHYLSPGIPMVEYVNSLIREQDVAPYGIILSGLCVVFCALAAIRHEDYRPRMSYLFLGMSFLPLVIGIIGWRYRLYFLEVWYLNVLAESPEQGRNSELEMNYASAVHLAFDHMWFAIVMFSVSIAAAFNHWAGLPERRAKDQGKPQKSMRNRVMKAWLAYFVLHASATYMLGMLNLLNLEMYYHHVLGVKTGAPMSLKVILSALLGMIISFLVFRMVCNKIVLGAQGQGARGQPVTKDNV
jgi:hypothetical protein